MEIVPVRSSNIASVGYDEESETLEIEFTTGAIYEYYDVPSAIHEGLISARSHGRYFHQHIRNRYTYSQIS